MRLSLTTALLAGSLAFAGCGGRPDRDGVTTPVAPETPLELRMTFIGQRLLELGYETSGWSRSGEIGPGEQRVSSLRASATGRLVLVAIGDAEAAANLNLTVVGPSSATEAEDEAADLRAAVELAVLAGATYRVRIANASDESSTGFLLRAFAAGPSVEPAPLFGVFDADAAMAPVWDDVVARAEALGMTGGLVARTVSVGRGERLSEQLQLEDGTCYLFAAQGSAGIDSVGIRLSDGEILLVADLAERQTAWVRHCPEGDVDARLTFEVIAGSGRLRIEGWSAQRAQMDEALVGPPLRSRGPLATIEAAMRWADQQLARSGYDPAEVQFEGELGAGERRQRRIRLSEGECAVFSALPGPGIRDLDIEVESPDGRLVAADSTPGPSSLVRLCSPGAGEYRVSLVGRGGDGFAVLMVSRLPRVELPIASKNPPRGALEAAAVFRRHSLEPLSEIVGLEREQGGTSPVWTASVELEQGRCYGIGAAADGAAIERLELIRPSGEPAAIWKQDRLPATLTSCAQESGSFAVRVVLAGKSREPAPLLLLFGSDAVAFSPIGTP